MHSDQCLTWSKHQVLVLLGERGSGSRWASRTFAAPSSSKYVSEGRFRLMVMTS